MDSGILSRFLGCWDQDFYGGQEIQAFENEWSHYFGVKHAIAVNSCTSGLYCAVGASGVGPGDEVIVSHIQWQHLLPARLFSMQCLYLLILNQTFFV